MVSYECFNEYGTHVTTIDHPSENLETIIIEHKGKYYRPICYSFHDGVVAKCVPVKIINSKTGGGINASISA